MSIECLNNALKVEGLTPTKKFVLVILANYADSRNSCFPSHHHVGKMVGVKDAKHIGRIIRELEQLGYLTIKNRYKEDGGNISNEYLLTIPSGLQTPTPLDNPTQVVSATPNTKEDTKESYIEESFKQFWKLYPRKINKYQAKQKYLVAIKTYGKEKLIEMADRFALQVELESTEEKFIPYCATWLNGKRYLDLENNTKEEMVVAHNTKQAEKPSKSAKDNRPQWAKDKDILDEQTERMVQSNWSTSDNEKSGTVNPDAHKKLAAMAEKHKLKGRSR